MVGVRDQLNQKPSIAVGALILVITILLGFTYVQLHVKRQPSSAATSLHRYYTVDDGKTWFADDWNQIPPFDHGGQQAVRCYVFKTAGGATFAGYLEKYTPQMHDQLAGVTQVSGPVVPYNGTLVKRPGDKAWVLELSPAGLQITKVKSSDGSSLPPEQVSP